MNGECEQHRRGIDKLVKDLWLSHNYIDVIERTKYFNGPKVLGEVDVYAYNNHRIDIFEYKSNPANFRYAYKQLLRVHDTNPVLEPHYFLVTPKYHIELTKLIMARKMPTKKIINSLLEEQYLRSRTMYR